MDKPWGESRISTGTTPTQYQYTGQRKSVSGLYYYNARWYDPSLGRFIQPDSIIPSIGEGNSAISIGYLENTNSIALTVDFHEIKFLEQLNAKNTSDQRFAITPTNQIAYDRYAYTLNNPINYNDPNGHNPIIEGILIYLGTPLGLFTVSCVIAAGVVFYAVGGPEALGDAIYQTGNAAADLSQQLANATSEATDIIIDISQADNLPKTGDLPYVPPKQKGNPPYVRTPDGGFIDKDGNIWRRDKSQHGGPHWDVELKNGEH